MDEQSRFIISDQLLDRRAGQDLIVHRFETDDVFVLNAHARMIFDALREGATRSEIKAHVVACGFVDAAASAKVDTALDEMFQQGIIIVHEAGPAG